jgi:EF hand
MMAMITHLRKLAQALPGVSGPRALVLGLALLSAGCASGSSGGAGMSSQELYNEYDVDNNNQIDQNEWDGAYRAMDTNGDGVVSQGEFNAAMGGGRR